MWKCCFILFHRSDHFRSKVYLPWWMCPNSFKWWTVGRMFGAQGQWVLLRNIFPACRLWVSLSYSPQSVLTELWTEVSGVKHNPTHQTWRLRFLLRLPGVCPSSAGACLMFRRPGKDTVAFTSLSQPHFCWDVSLSFFVPSKYLQGPRHGIWKGNISGGWILPP